MDLENIAGGERLVAMLGEYPCFHDANVESLSLAGAQTGKGFDAELMVVINRYESEASGNATLINSTAFSFNFLGFRIGHLRLDIFPELILNIKVCLAEKSVRSDLPWEVEIDFAIGGSMSLACESVEITGVTCLSEL